MYNRERVKSHLVMYNKIFTHIITLHLCLLMKDVF